MNIELRKLRKQWYEKRIESNKSDSKNLWKVISEVVETKNSSKCLKTNKFDVNLMNDNFIQTPLLLNKNFENFENKHYFEDLSAITDKCFRIMPITEDKITEVLQKTDSKKSIGIDGISTKFLKICLFLIPILKIIFNKSLEFHKFPDIWKTALVKALYKGGDRKLFSNYRPISVLPIISKIFERLVYNQLFDFVSENKLLSDNQFGFRSRHSCTDALLSIQRNILINLNNKKKVCILSIDMKKAFDTVSHQILIYKLFRIWI